MWRALLLSVVLFLTTDIAFSQSSLPSTESQLPKIAPLRLTGGPQLGPGPVRENSGIVKSRLWPNVFWMQNDSGDEPRVYAVRRDGSVHASDRYELPGTLIGGAINVDWEDIGVDKQGHLIVAGFGNNRNDRRDLVLYYLMEPDPTAGRTTWLRRVFFRYPDQEQFPAPSDNFNFDGEALFAIDDVVYVLSKHCSDTATRLYRFDPKTWHADQVNTLEYVERFVKRAARQ